jgi:hypothetical protein
MNKDIIESKSINEYETAEKLAKNYISDCNNSKYFDFIYGKNRNLLKEISSGSEMMPSHSFFDEVSKLGVCERARQNCLLASKLATEYYINTFNSGLRHRDNFKEFASEFEEVSQPIGRRLVNYILLMRLHILDKEFEQQDKKLMKLLNQIAIKMTGLFSTDPRKAELVYTGISVSIISLVSVGCFFVAGGLDSLFASVLSSVSTAIAGVIVSLSVHRFNSFEHTDISGKNLLALKYKSIFIHQLTNFSKKKKNSSSSVDESIDLSNGENVHTAYGEEKYLEIA